MTYRVPGRVSAYYQAYYIGPDLLDPPQITIGEPERPPFAAVLLIAVGLSLWIGVAIGIALRWLW